MKMKTFTQLQQIFKFNNFKFLLKALILPFALIVTSAQAQEGTILKHQKISDTQGGLSATLDNGDFFGISMEPIGDLDSDGNTDMVAGAIRDDDGGTNRGAVYVLFLNADGSIISESKISDTQGGFTGGLNDNDFFGRSVASLGDLDGDGVNDIAVGAPMDDDGGTNKGAAWVLFMTDSGTVKSQQKISDLQGSFAGTLDDNDYFGWSMAGIGDLNLDGIGDLVVGSYKDDDNGMDRGAIWILFLDSNGTVKSHQKISDTQGGFSGTLSDRDYFGKSVTSLGDLDGDGVHELAVGAEWDDDGGMNKGAVWILDLNSSGIVVAEQKISDTQGGFTGTLDVFDYFGSSVSATGDLDGDNVTDIIVGASNDDDGGINRGASWLLFLNQDGTVKAHQKISDTQGDFDGVLDNVDLFGATLVSLGDLDGDNVIEIAIGAYRDDDGGMDRGAMYIISQTIVITAITTGNWKTAGTWNCNCIPNEGDIAIIEAGHTVTVVDPQTIDSIVIYNSSSGDTRLTIDGTTFSTNKGLLVSGEVAGATNMAIFEIVNTGSAEINGNIYQNADTKDALVEVSNTAKLTVNGNVYLNETGGQLAEFKIKDNALSILNGDFIYKATQIDKARVRLEDAAILEITGGFDRSALGNYGELDCEDNSIVDFVGTTPQTMSMIAYGPSTMNWRYAEVHINNPTGVTLDAGISQLTISNTVSEDLRILTGQLNSGGYSIDLPFGKVFEIADGAKYYTTTIDPTGGMMNNITGGVHEIGAESTVEFAALGNQNVPRHANLKAYGNLIISGTAIKTLTSDIYINGDLTINSILDVGPADYMIVLAGNWINNGIFDGHKGSVKFNGSGIQSINGVSTSFHDLVMEKPSEDVVLNTDISATILKLWGGDIVLGANDLTIQAGNTVLGGDPTSYIQADISGRMIKYFDVTDLGKTFNFAIGDYNDYSPMDVTINTAMLVGDDYLSLRVTDGVHPDMDPGDQLSRYWTLGSGGFNAINFYFNCHYLDEDIVGTESNLLSIKLDPFGWTKYESVDIDDNKISNYSAPIKSVFMGMIISAGGGGVSPTTLNDFSAKQIDEMIGLSWQTAFELNSDYFTIERSSDKINYEALKQLNAAGTSSIELDYFILDENPIVGMNYYRLKITNLNGEVTNFSDIGIYFENEKASPVITVFPNPSDGETINITFTGIDEDMNLVLYDMYGEELFSKMIKHHNGSMLTVIEPTSELQPGIYFVVGMGESNIYRQKLIVR